MNYFSSVITDKDVFYPPSGKLVFNRMLKTDDGLLANFISAEENISFIDARAVLNQFVERVRKDLNNTGNFLFDDIGTITQVNSLLTFEPARELNFYTGSFGLKEYCFRKISHNLPVEHQVHNPKPLKNNRNSIHLNFSKVAAAILIISLVTLITDSIPLSQVHLLEKCSIEPPVKLLLNKSLRKTEPIRTINKPVIVTVREKTELNTSVHTEQIDMTRQIQIIAGCFKSHENAVNYCEDLKLKGISSLVMEKSHGLYKVTVGSGSSSIEAVTLLREKQGALPGIQLWLFRQ